jgi:ATP-binding cassette subfamily B multidrug efflux pump
VQNNLRYGRPEVSDPEVIAAAKLARADCFIEQLPQRYRTVLGERGRGLSQRQRHLAAIARDAVASACLPILDEAAGPWTLGPSG